MKIDFFDTAKKPQIYSLAFGPRLARTRKIEFAIFVAKTNLNAANRPLDFTDFEWFSYILSKNIANLEIVFLVHPKRPQDIRFPWNYEVAKTLQNTFNIQNPIEFSTSKTQKITIFIGNCSYFRLPGNVAIPWKTSASRSGFVASRNLAHVSGDKPVSTLRA